MLSLAVKSRCAVFHHISTAYVAGRRTGLCREEFVETEHFNNVYEETKYRGEELVREACRRAGIRMMVYRPSIVYGDSRSGRSLRFNALYFPVKTTAYLKELFLRDIQDGTGRQAAAMGVTLDPDGAVRLPIRIETQANGRINAVPVDFFVRACLALMEARPGGGISHIVHPSGTPLEDLVVFARKFLELRGIKAVIARDFAVRERNPLESLMDRYLDIYRPYMVDTRVFSQEKTEPILRSDGIVCPDLDYERFARCMQYAVDTDWGRKL